MGLKGSAFLVMWHDIAEGAVMDYIEWHTREHMPERLSIPGFTTGKRLHAPNASRYAFGTIYAGESLETFRSPDYLERLNNPTPWTASYRAKLPEFPARCLRDDRDSRQWRWRQHGDDPLRPRRR